MREQCCDESAFVASILREVVRRGQWRREEGGQGGAAKPGGPHQIATRGGGPDLGCMYGDLPIGRPLRGARMTERPNIAADLPYARAVPGCRIQRVTRRPADARGTENVADAHCGSDNGPQRGQPRLAQRVVERGSGGGQCTAQKGGPGSGGGRGQRWPGARVMAIR